MEIYGGTGNFSRGRHASGAATTRTKSKRTRPDPQKSRVAWPSPLTTANQAWWKVEDGEGDGDLYISKRSTVSVGKRRRPTHTQYHTNDGDKQKGAHTQPHGFAFASQHDETQRTQTMHRQWHNERGAHNRNERERESLATRVNRGSDKPK